MEIEEQIKRCKQCKLSFKKYGHSCKKHITLNHINMLIVSGTKSQDEHPTNNKLKAIEDFTKAIAVGIEYLVNKKG